MKLDEFNNLTIKYGICRSISKQEYYKGLLTETGILSEAEWMKQAEKLIKKYNEAHITECLEKYYKETCMWLKNATNENIRFQAINAHMRRLFENPNWVGYIDFKNKYLESSVEIGIVIEKDYKGIEYEQFKIV